MRELIQPGNWYAYCCEQDLDIIEDEEHADELRKDWDDGILVGIWESREAALATPGFCSHEV